MKLIIKHSTKALLLMLFILAGIEVNAQDPARLHFEQLNALENKALDVVEVNVDGKMLELAIRVLAKSSDKDALQVGKAISGLKGIYVRVYNFEKENEYNVADVEQIRSQLNAPGWQRLANVRSKKNNQKVDVYTMFTGNNMSGLAVVISESKSVALVNVIGPIDIDLLAELSGKMNIPKIEIENDKPKQQ
jgi:hypothetical protein